MEISGLRNLRIIRENELGEQELAEQGQGGTWTLLYKFFFPEATFKFSDVAATTPASRKHDTTSPENNQDPDSQEGEVGNILTKTNRTNQGCVHELFFLLFGFCFCDVGVLCFSLRFGRQNSSVDWNRSWIFCSPARYYHTGCCDYGNEEVRQQSVFSTCPKDVVLCLG